MVVWASIHGQSGGLRDEWYRVFVSIDEVKR